MSILIFESWVALELEVNIGADRSIVISGSNENLKSLCIRWQMPKNYGYMQTTSVFNIDLKTRFPAMDLGHGGNGLFCQQNAPEPSGKFPCVMLRSGGVRSEPFGQQLS